MIVLVVVVIAYFGCGIQYLWHAACSRIALCSYTVNTKQCISVKFNTDLTLLALRKCAASITVIYLDLLHTVYSLQRTAMKIEYI